MSVFLKSLKQSGHFDDLHIKICNIGSRKLTSSDPKYNFANKIVKSLAQFQELVKQGLELLPIFKMSKEDILIPFTFSSYIVKPLKSL